MVQIVPPRVQNLLSNRSTSQRKCEPWEGRKFDRGIEAIVYRQVIVKECPDMYRQSWTRISCCDYAGVSGEGRADVFHAHRSTRVVWTKQPPTCTYVYPYEIHYKLLRSEST